MKHTVLMTAAAIVALLPTAMPSQARDVSPHEKAVAMITADPDAAERQLNTQGNATEELDYALFLHAFRPHNAANRAKIEHLVGNVRAAIARSGDYWGKGEVGEIIKYDGKDHSLIPLIRGASMSGAGQTMPAFYAIPCGVLQKRPGLLEATQPLYGGNGDNFLPRSGCQWMRRAVAGYPEALVSAYMDLADRADGCIACGSGTIRFSLESEENLRQERMRLDPRYFLNSANSFETPLQAYPYQVWSYASLSNRRLGHKIEASYRQTRAALAIYYRTKGLSEAQSVKAASRALFSAPFGANCGKGPLKTSLRTLVLDNASPAAIAAYLASHKDGNITHDAIAICAGTDGKDPMAHIALGNPKLFQLLADKAANLPEDKQTAQDLQMDVNQPNPFGKTPLMTAAQFHLIEGARYLITHGADVHAALPVPGNLHSTKRTALHYAAASGYLPMIHLLIAHGADIRAKDAVGQDAFFTGGKDTPGNQTPLDYFQGNGPVPAPKVLDSKDRAAAVQALGG